MGIKRHIPNAITSLNLICGVIGIICVFDTTFGGWMGPSFMFMLAAVFFDFFDGLAARLPGVQSSCGKELDSLADVVSFGVLPSLMMSEMCRSHAEGWMAFLSWIPLLIAVFSALRLARFNIDEKQHDSFIGLPTPASALICGSFCSSAIRMPASWGNWIPVVIVAISLVLCFLMVCGLPMFSFKFGKDTKADTVTRMKRSAIISISAIVVVLVIAFGLPWQTMILGILLAYILENALLYFLAPGDENVAV